MSSVFASLNGPGSPSLRQLALAFDHHYQPSPRAGQTDIRGRPTDSSIQRRQQQPTTAHLVSRQSPIYARSLTRVQNPSSCCVLLTNRSRSLRRTRAMNFFKTKPRTPSELVRGLRDAILKLDGGQPGGDTRRKVQNYLSLSRFTSFISLTRLARISPRVLHRSRPSCLATEVRAHPCPTFPSTHPTTLRHLLEKSSYVGGI
jgi:hypothetical protein